MLQAQVPLEVGALGLLVAGLGAVDPGEQVAGGPDALGQQGPQHAAELRAGEGGR